MNGIESGLHSELRDALLRYAPVDDYNALLNIFTDGRISPWRNQIPHYSQPDHMADALIAKLWDCKRADTGENVLVLFLQVLCKNDDPVVARRVELTSLARRLEQEIDGPSLSGTIDQFAKMIRNLLARGDLGLALAQLNNYVRANASGEIQNQVENCLKEYSVLQRDERKSFTTQEEAQTNQLRKAQLIEELNVVLDAISGQVLPKMEPVLQPEMGDHASAIPDNVQLEKIIGANNLKEIAWLARGLDAAKSVCRIHTPAGIGTGFLIGPNRIMTNHHVIGDGDTATQSVAEFNCQTDIGGKPLTTFRYRLGKEGFYTNKELDYSIVGVQQDPRFPALESWGCLPLCTHADPMPGEHVTIIQHPYGGFKQIALTANQVVSVWEYRLHYATDTMPGSSGSPVFNDRWEVVAIHHAGGTLQVNSGGDQRFINEGILLSAIEHDAREYWPS